MRGLIVDEGRLNGLLVDEAAQPLQGLGWSGWGEGEEGASSGFSFASLLLPAAQAFAGYFAYKHGYKKTGVVLGAFAALNTISRVGG